MAAGWTIGCSGVLATRARTAVAFVAAPVPTATLTLTLAALAPAASRPRFPPSAPPLPHCVETAAMQPDVSRLPLPALCLSACWSSSPSSSARRPRPALAAAALAAALGAAALAATLAASVFAASALAAAVLAVTVASFALATTASAAVPGRVCESVYSTMYVGPVGCAYLS